MNDRQSRLTRRSAVATIALAAASTALLAPAPALAHEPESGCEVASGSLAWGVKETFRSYIGSSIANGTWEATDGATYATPVFGWTAPTGAIDPATGSGQAAFTGTVTFSGHGGLLHLVLSDPVIHFGDDGATLLLDVLSNDAEGAVAIDEQDVVFATLPIDVAATAWEPGGTQSWPALAPVVLTETGAAAFGGFYAAGDELDPIALELTLAETCTSAETAEPTAGPQEPIEAPDDDLDIAAPASGGLVGGIVAAVVLAAGGVAASIAAVRQRRRD